MGENKEKCFGGPHRKRKKFLVFEFRWISRVKSNTVQIFHLVLKLSCFYIHLLMNFGISDITISIYL